MHNTVEQLPPWLCSRSELILTAAHWWSQLLCPHNQARHGQLVLTEATEGVLGLLCSMDPAHHKHCRTQEYTLRAQAHRTNVSVRLGLQPSPHPWVLYVQRLHRDPACSHLDRHTWKLLERVYYALGVFTVLRHEPSGTTGAWPFMLWSSCYYVVRAAAQSRHTGPTCTQPAALKATHTPTKPVPVHCGVCQSCWKRHMQWRSAQACALWPNGPPDGGYLKGFELLFETFLKTAVAWENRLPASHNSPMPAYWSQHTQHTVFGVSAHPSFWRRVMKHWCVWRNKCHTLPNDMIVTVHSSRHYTHPRKHTRSKSVGRVLGRADPVLPL